VYVSELAIEVERQRFRLAHRLGGDPQRLDEQLVRLARTVPFHPVVLNERARRLLPETWPEPPPLELAPVAQALLAGQVDDAYRTASELASERRGDGQVQMALGDLQLLRGDAGGAETSFRRGMELLGPLPCLMVRYGRCRLLHGATKEAWKLVVGALTQCPIYGSGHALYADVAAAAGRALIPVPLPLPLVQDGDRVVPHPDLTAPAAAAWARYVAHPGQGTPPGLLRARAALDLWTSSRETEERADAEVQVLPTLAAWQQAGLLRSYLWIVGLSSDNVADFRSWIVERPHQMRAFWELGPTGQAGRHDRP